MAKLTKAEKAMSMEKFMEKEFPSGGDQGSLAPQFRPNAKMRSTSDGYMYAEKSPAKKKKMAVPSLKPITKATKKNSSEKHDKFKDR